MEYFKVLAGDFEAGSVGVIKRSWSGELKHLCVGRDDIPFEAIVSVDVVTEENAKRLSGALGWGVAGGLAFGPVGALAGFCPQAVGRAPLLPDRRTSLGPVTRVRLSRQPRTDIQLSWSNLPGSGALSVSMKGAP